MQGFNLPKIWLISLFFPAFDFLHALSVNAIAIVRPILLSISICRGLIR